MEDAALVADEVITRDVQAVADVGRLAIVREVAAACGSPDGEVSDGTVGHGPHLVVDDADLVTGDRPARRPWRSLLEAVADEDV